MSNSEQALRGMLSMIGNVDHSRGGGESTARLYGQMLNDFRDMAKEALAKDERSRAPLGATENIGSIPA